MARTFWCRHEACRKPFEAEAGFLPPVCPKCQQSAHWAASKDTPIIVERRKHGKRPRMKYATTLQDYKLFLKRLKISPE